VIGPRSWRTTGGERGRKAANFVLVPRLGRFEVKRDLGCLPGDLDLRFFSQLTDHYGVCLDHITIDLQMPVQGSICTCEDATSLSSTTRSCSCPCPRSRLSVH